MTAFVTGRGRPLRFLALVCVVWVAVRIALLWLQTGSLPEAIREFVPVHLPSLPPRETPEPAPATKHRPSPLPRTAPAVHAAAPVKPRVDRERLEMALLSTIRFGPAEYVDKPRAAAPFALPAPAAVAQQPFRPMISRWSGSAWLVARPGSGLGAAPGGQLGGGQAGARIAWLLDPDRRIALFGRAVTPLQGKGREAALGVEWQPGRAPVRLVAEYRFAIDGGRSGPGLGLVAGTDSRIPAGFRLETYAQAGAIRRDRIEPYADGAARATRTIAHLGPARLALGGGVWGAAQRDAQRLDAGPSATLELPVAGQNFRLAVDWRQRVAGNARPGSGLALTLGSDF